MSLVGGSLANLAVLWIALGRIKKPPRAKADTGRGDVWLQRLARKVDHTQPDLQAGDDVVYTSDEGKQRPGVLLGRLRDSGFFVVQWPDGIDVVHGGHFACKRVDGQ